MLGCSFQNWPLAVSAGNGKEVPWKIVSFTTFFHKVLKLATLFLISLWASSFLSSISAFKLLQSPSCKTDMCCQKTWVVAIAIQHGRVKNLYCLFFTLSQTKAVGQHKHCPVHQLVTSLGSWRSQFRNKTVTLLLRTAGLQSSTRHWGKTQGNTASPLYLE